MKRAIKDEAEDEAEGSERGKSAHFPSGSSAGDTTSPWGGGPWGAWGLDNLPH